MAKDALFEHVELLLLCNGANGSTTFTDSSPRTKTVAACETVALRTDRYKFGGACGNFNGNGFLEITDFGTGFDFGSDPFCVEFFHYAPDMTEQIGSTFFNIENIGLTLAYGNYSERTKLVMTVAGYPVISATHGMTAGNWYHIAFVRHAGNTADIFIDGVSIGSATGLADSEPITNPSIERVDFGLFRGFGPQNRALGDYDYIRITKGVDRYPSAFTPPTTEFSTSGNDIDADPLVEVGVWTDLLYQEPVLTSQGVVVSEASALLHSVAAGLAETATASTAGDEPLVTGVGLTNTAASTSAIQGNFDSVLSELATGTTVFSGLLALVAPSTGNVLTGDGQTISVIGGDQLSTLLESALATTALSADVGVSPADALVSAGQAQSALGPSDVRAMPLVESGVTTTALGTGWVASVAETVTGISVIGGQLAHEGAPLDNALVGASMASAIQGWTGTLLDSVAATSAISAALALVGGELSSVGVLTDQASAGALQALLVLNAETGAVSTYTLAFEIQGWVAVEGVLWLAGPDGLYALDADADDTGRVVWTLQTGFSALGSETLKRIQDVDVLCRTDSDLTVTLVSGRLGQKTATTYRLTPANREANRDGVIQVGQGPISVNWQLGLQGLGPTEIDSTILTVDPLSRRR